MKRWKIIENEIKFLQEEAYRRGFSHGAQMGFGVNSEDMEAMTDKINSWKNDLYDQPFFRVVGAPGTILEDKIMYQSPDILKQVMEEITPEQRKQATSAFQEYLKEIEKLNI